MRAGAGHGKSGWLRSSHPLQPSVFRLAWQPKGRWNEGRKGKGRNSLHDVFGGGYATNSKGHGCQQHRCQRPGGREWRPYRLVKQAACAGARQSWRCSRDRSATGTVGRSLGPRRTLRAVRTLDSRGALPRTLRFGRTLDSPWTLGAGRSLPCRPQRRCERRRRGRTWRGRGRRTWCGCRCWRRR